MSIFGLSCPFSSVSCAFRKTTDLNRPAFCLQVMETIMNRSIFRYMYNIFVYACVHIYICVCVYVYIYIYIYICSLCCGSQLGKTQKKQVRSQKQTEDEYNIISVVIENTAQEMLIRQLLT